VTRNMELLYDGPFRKDCQSLTCFVGMPGAAKKVNALTPLCLAQCNAA